MRPGSFLRILRKLLPVLALAAVPVWAQSGLGVVTGTVTDASKASLPKAKVVLTDTATGVARSGETNGAGIYYFGSVPIGPYTLSVEASGFQRFEGQLTVAAGQTVEVSPTLQVGSLTSKVDVTAVSVAVTTEGAQISDVKDAARIHDLPINGRQISNLFTLTPGVEGGVDGNGNTVGGGAPRTNGMMVGSTEILLDGISYVDRFGGGISRVQPGLDTVQEFRIETAGSGAQFDRPATIELVTRSGTNEFHGALFETLRNNAAGLRARQRSDDNTTAKYIRNEFGGQAGGRIIKNKTFWFGDYEVLRQRQNTFATTAVPTQAMWNGDLSNITDSSGSTYQLYDPYSTKADGSRTPFPNNIIPANRIATNFVKGIQSITPLPTGPNAGVNPWLGNNFQTFYPINTNASTLTAKIDQIFSQKDNLSVRYTQSLQDYAQFGGRYGFPPIGTASGTGTEGQKSNVYSTSLHWTHVFSPTLLNDLQLAGHRSSNNSGTIGGNSINWDQKLGLPNPFGATGWPTLCTDAGSFLYYGCLDGDNQKGQQLTQYQADDNVTWVKGKHTIKAGFKYRKELNNVQELQQSQGSDSFYGDWTAQYDPVGQQAASFTGSGFASLLLGLPTYLSNQYNHGYYYFRQTELGAYIDDTWRVTSRLTIGAGLRWDYWTPYHEKYNRIDNIDLNTVQGNQMQVVLPGNTKFSDIPGIPAGVISSWTARGLTAVPANSVGFPSALFPQVYNDFGPRLSAAYKLTDKMVLRGGYGIYYWPMPLSQILQSARVNAPLNLRFQNSIADQNGTYFNYALTNVPQATDKVGGAIVDPNSKQGISSRSQSFFAFDPKNWNDNKAQEWTFTIEREVMRNTVLKLTYAGNHGSNLEQRWYYDTPESKYNYQAATGLLAPTNTDLLRKDPNWNLSNGNAGVLRHNGYSNSNSAQVNLERRFTSGLAFQIFYVYTHALTTNDSGGGSAGTGSVNATGASSFVVPTSNIILGNPTMTNDQLLRLGYFNSSQVPPQRVTWNGVYQLPFGKGKRFGSNSNRFTNALIGGWQLAFIGTWASGFWGGVSSGDYLFGNPSLSSDKRLNLTIFGKNQQLYFAGDFNPTGATNVNLSQLEALVPVDRSQRILRPIGPGLDNRVPQTLANGMVVNTPIGDNVNPNSRNFILGPASWNQDLTAFKYFDLTERAKLRFNADFFNAFNHPNNVLPNTTTGLIDLSRQANDPRIIQFGLRLEW